MTLCAAWVRTVGNVQELLFASDSRLSGGEQWDGCPKMLPLPRRDCLVAFAGSTLRSYPLMLQLYASIDSFPASRRRVLDFDEMKGHAVRVFNFMLGKVQHEVSGAKVEFIRELSDTSFLLLGYSWRKKRFRIVEVRFDSSSHQYRSHSFSVRRRTCIFIGDKDVSRDVDLPKTANERLNEKLLSVGKLPAGTLDFEPFDVVRDMILDDKFRTVGGPIQFAKVYAHLNTQTFAVYWPSERSGRLTIAGRDTLHYEKPDWPRIDAMTHELSGIALDDATIHF